MAAFHLLWVQSHYAIAAEHMTLTARVLRFYTEERGLVRLNTRVPGALLPACDDSYLRYIRCTLAARGGADFISDLDYRSPQKTAAGFSSIRLFLPGRAGILPKRGPFGAASREKSFRLYLMAFRPNHYLPVPRAKAAERGMAVNR